jgi:hypothetical protein
MHLYSQSYGPGPGLRMFSAVSRTVASRPPRLPRALYIVKPSPAFVIRILPSPWTRHVACITAYALSYMHPLSRLFLRGTHMRFRAS